jgi:competence protein ComEA
MSLRSQIHKMGWTVRYVPHEVIADYNATYNVESEGRRVVTDAAKRLGIPRDEIWISERWRPYEEFILFHEFQEIRYRAEGLSPEEAHDRATEDTSAKWGGDERYRRMVEEMAEADVETAVSKARQALAENGYACSVSPEDLRKYFEADTPYEGPSLEEIIKNDFLVIHELVEIDEIMRKGLKLTKDVILANMDTIYEVHLKAAEVELEMAYRAGDLDHIRSRLQDIRNWLEDPLLPAPLTETCEKLYRKVNGYLQRASGP